MKENKYKSSNRYYKKRFTFIIDARVRSSIQLSRSTTVVIAVAVVVKMALLYKTTSMGRIKYGGARAAATTQLAIRGNKSGKKTGAREQ